MVVTCRLQRGSKISRRGPGLSPACCSGGTLLGPLAEQLGQSHGQPPPPASDHADPPKDACGSQAWRKSFVLRTMNPVVLFTYTTQILLVALFEPHCMVLVLCPKVVAGCMCLMRFVFWGGGWGVERSISRPDPQLFLSCTNLAYPAKLKPRRGP